MMRSLCTAIVFYGSILLAMPLVWLMSFVHDTKSSDYVKLCAQIGFAICTLCGIQFHYRIHNPYDVSLNDRMMWICNHRSYLDGILLQFALTHYFDSNLMIVTKQQLKSCFMLGRIFKGLEYLFIARGHAWDFVEKQIQSHVTNHVKSILIFPEGTTYSPATVEVSRQYEKQNNLAPFHHVLCPRQNGFRAIAQHGQYDTVANMTIRYRNPSLCDTNLSHDIAASFFHFPRSIYLNIEIMKFDQINLLEIFRRKDALLEKRLKSCAYQIMETDGMSRLQALILVLSLLSFNIMACEITWGLTRRVLSFILSLSC